MAGKLVFSCTFAPAEIIKLYLFKFGHIVFFGKIVSRVSVTCVQDVLGCWKDYAFGV